MSLCATKPKIRRKKKPRPNRAGKIKLGRRRERGKLVSENLVKWHWQTKDLLGTVVPLPEPVEQNYLRRYEVMIDDVGNLQNKWNRVDHEKYLVTGFTQPNYLLGMGNAAGASTAIVPEVLEHVRSLMPSPTLEVFNELAEASKEHFITVVKNDVLLVNFILELVEMCKGDAEQYRKSLAWFKQRLWVFWVRYQDYLKKGFSDSAAYWLAWNFAIKPFLKDLKNIVCGYFKAQKRYQWLINHNGKWVDVDYRRKDVPVDEWDKTHLLGSAGSYFAGTWVPEAPPWESGLWPEALPSPENWYFRFTKFELTYCSQGNCLFAIPSYKLTQGGSSQVFMSMMGIDRIGSIIWEAIPFSFVVDWFTDLGKDLASLGDSLTKNYPDAFVKETGHSFKLDAEFVLSKGVPEQSVEDREVIVSGIYRRYWRDKGLPSGKTSLLTWGIDSPYRLSLSSALYHQKFRGLARRRRKGIKDLGFF